MNRVHDDLLAVLDAIEIVSPREYIIAGERREWPAVSPPESGAIVSAIAEDLYDRLYRRPSRPAQGVVDEPSRRDLVAALSAANAGAGRWESGWTVEEVGTGEVVAARDGLVFSFPETHVRGTIRPGGPCRALVPKEIRGLIPGFYMAIGDAEEFPDDGHDDPGPELRFYWHLRPESAVALIAATTTLLNAARIAFRVKVLRDPDAYCRADAGVLYIRRRDLGTVMPLVARIHGDIAGGLRPEVPMFTRRLADGLGFAEHDSPSESFGQHRCRLVAEAFWRSFARGESDREARIDGLASAFAAEGLDAAHPHRGPGGRAEDEPEPLVVSHAVAAVETATGPAAAPTMSLVEAAARIGRALCRSAYWDADGRLCNWVGRSTRETDPAFGRMTPTSAAVGPEVYLGSAGIALFLAELHRATGDHEFRRTALGAIRRSIARLSRPAGPDAPSPLSFYLGAMGIAYVCWRVSALTGDAALLGTAAAIVGALPTAMSDPHDLDVIGGNAGAIPALLAMRRTPGLGDCGPLAIELGEELRRLDLSRSGVRLARVGGRPTSVPEDSTRSGLSHGASGVGLALLELHAATDRADFRDSARRALAYEDTLFDAGQGNWADRRRTGGPPQYELAWCNGAPGIVLARAHAAMLDPDRAEVYLGMARAGLATTLAAIEENLARPRSDATPCHGLTGLIEIVSIAARMLDDADSRERSSAAAQALIGGHAMPEDWPSGLYSGGQNPSLMLGNAGIGYTFLRLHAPDHVPSMLWIGA